MLTQFILDLLLTILKVLSLWYKNSEADLIGLLESTSEHNLIASIFRHRSNFSIRIVPLQGLALPRAWGLVKEPVGWVLMPALLWVETHKVSVSLATSASSLTWGPQETNVRFPRGKWRRDKLGG